MTTQIKVNVPTQSNKKYCRQQGFYQILVLVAILVVGLTLSACAADLSAVEPENAQPIADSAFNANAARYNGLAKYYAAKKDEQLIRQQILNTDAARYSGLAEYYHTKRDEANNQRAFEAETARYNGLTGYYQVEVALTSTLLAANPELSAHRHYTSPN